ncbi:MAG TPA: hypothetical protein VJ991_04235 [Balneolales bacterium]|nr:hypothetical protein [Balneolales bacterium]
MKYRNKISLFLVGIAGLIISLSACSKSNSVTGNNKNGGANEITSTTLTGHVKGTMDSGKTYTITGDIYVDAGDTLMVKPGVTVNVKNNSTFFINGTIMSMGTQSQPITFTAPQKQSGSWGGFQADSAQAVTFHWTHINYTGGPDPTGSPRVTLVVHAPIKVDFEDSWILDGVDNALEVNDGAQLTMLRNTIEHQGSTDGEGFDCYRGVTGTIAYNVIWGGAGNGLKIQTDNTILHPETNLKIYNNDFIDNGYRRGAAEPGAGITFDQFAEGEIYNNMFISNYYGLAINKAADTTNTSYGNNYFWTDVDSTRQYYYPQGDWGKPQSSDIISTSASDKNPMFKSYSKDPMAATDNNDYHLQSGSPAIGAGNPKYNNDIGAYPSDGSGNKH